MLGALAQITQPVNSKPELEHGSPLTNTAHVTPKPHATQLGEGPGLDQDQIAEGRGSASHWTEWRAPTVFREQIWPRRGKVRKESVEDVKERNWGKATSSKRRGASHLPGAARGPFILRFLNLILHAVFHSSQSLSALVLFGTPPKVNIAINNNE